MKKIEPDFQEKSGSVVFRRRSGDGRNVFSVRDDAILNRVGDCRSHGNHAGEIAELMIRNGEFRVAAVTESQKDFFAPLYRHYRGIEDGPGNMVSGHSRILADLERFLHCPAGGFDYFELGLIGFHLAFENGLKGNFEMEVCICVYYPRVPRPQPHCRCRDYRALMRPLRSAILDFIYRTVFFFQIQREAVNLHGAFRRERVFIFFSVPGDNNRDFTHDKPPS